MCVCHCVQGAAPSQCSPFHPVVAPGPTVPALSEAESPSTETLDYLAEAIAGHFATVYIQAKVTDSSNHCLYPRPCRPFEDSVTAPLMTLTESYFVVC